MTREDYNLLMMNAMSFTKVQIKKEEYDRIKNEKLTYVYNGEQEEPLYYKIDDAGLTDREKSLALQAKQTLYLKSIKNMVEFFVIVLIVGIALAVIIGLMNIIH